MTHRGLPPGHQAAQSVHAAFLFARSFPLIAERWIETSNYLVLLAASDEDSLNELAERAATMGIKHVRFHEPDFPGEPLTAIALEPGLTARNLCASLPLALRDRDLAGSSRKG